MVDMTFKGPDRDDGQTVLRTLVDARLFDPTSGESTLNEALASSQGRPVEKVAGVYLLGLWHASDIIRELIGDLVVVMFERDGEGPDDDAKGEKLWQWREVVREWGEIDLAFRQQTEPPAPEAESDDG